MFREAAQAPAAVREQLQANAARVARLAARLRHAPPRAVVTCARGSSDHAATFARYLIETRLALLTSSAAPSVSSVYEAGRISPVPWCWRSRSREPAPIYWRR